MSRALKPNGQGPWYGIRDMVRLFDVSDRCIRKWEAAGRIPRAVRRGRRWTRWPKATVDEFLKTWVA